MYNPELEELLTTASRLKDVLKTFSVDVKDAISIHDAMADLHTMAENMTSAIGTTPEDIWGINDTRFDRIVNNDPSVPNVTKYQVKGIDFNLGKTKNPIHVLGDFEIQKMLRELIELVSCLPIMMVSIEVFDDCRSSAAKKNAVVNQGFASFAAQSYKVKIAQITDAIRSMDATRLKPFTSKVKKVRMVADTPEYRQTLETKGFIHLTDLKKLEPFDVKDRKFFITPYALRITRVEKLKEVQPVMSRQAGPTATRTLEGTTVTVSTTGEPRLVPVNRFAALESVPETVEPVFKEPKKLSQKQRKKQERAARKAEAKAARVPKLKEVASQHQKVNEETQTTTTTVGAVAPETTPTPAVAAPLQSGVVDVMSHPYLEQLANAVEEFVQNATQVAKQLDVEEEQGIIGGRIPGALPNVGIEEVTSATVGGAQGITSARRRRDVNLQ